MWCTASSVSGSKAMRSLPMIVTVTSYEGCGAAIFGATSRSHLRARGNTGAFEKCGCRR